MYDFMELYLKAVFQWQTAVSFYNILEYSKSFRRPVDSLDKSMV